MLLFLKYFLRKFRWNNWLFLLKIACLCKIWHHDIDLKKTAIFCRKLAKIAENIDHNISPWIPTRSWFVSLRVRGLLRGPLDVGDRCTWKNTFFSLVALRHRNKDPAPFRHPVDAFSSFCSIVWQHFARHCRQLRCARFYATITWVNSISLLKTYALC
jgi:hypothetical protein